MDDEDDLRNSSGNVSGDEEDAAVKRGDRDHSQTRRPSVDGEEGSEDAEPYFEWADEAVDARLFLFQHQLPQVVKLSSGLYSNLGEKTTLNSQQPFLLYSARRGTKVFASNLHWDEERAEHKRDGPALVIPVNYQGWFEIVPEEGTPVEIYDTVEQIAAVSPKRFLVRSATPAFTLHQDLNHRVWVRGMIPAGEVMTVYNIHTIERNQSKEKRNKGKCCLKLARFVRRMKKNNSKSSSLEPDKVDKYLQCMDASGKEYTIAFGQSGLFSPIGEPHIKSTDCVYQLSSIVRHMELPLTLHLVYGEPPITPCSFSRYLRLEEIYNDETIIACTMNNEHNVMLEVSVDSRVKFVGATNYQAYKEFPIYREILRQCDEKIDTFASSINVTQTAYTPKNPSTNKTRREPTLSVEADVERGQFEHETNEQSNGSERSSACSTPTPESRDTGPASCGSSSDGLEENSGESQAEEHGLVRAVPVFIQDHDEESADAQPIATKPNATQPASLNGGNDIDSEDTMKEESSLDESDDNTIIFDMSHNQNPSSVGKTDTVPELPKRHFDDRPKLGAIGRHNSAPVFTSNSDLKIADIQKRPLPNPIEEAKQNKHPQGSEDSSGGSGGSGSGSYRSRGSKTGSNHESDYDPDYDEIPGSVKIEDDEGYLMPHSKRSQRKSHKTQRNSSRLGRTREDQVLREIDEMFNLDELSDGSSSAAEGRSPRFADQVGHHSCSRCQHHSYDYDLRYGQMSRTPNPYQRGGRQCPYDHEYRWENYAADMPWFDPRFQNDRVMGGTMRVKKQNRSREMLADRQFQLNPNATVRKHNFKRIALAEAPWNEIREDLHRSRDQLHMLFAKGVKPQQMAHHIESDDSQEPVYDDILSGSDRDKPGRLRKPKGYNRSQSWDVFSKMAPEMSPGQRRQRKSSLPSSRHLSFRSDSGISVGGYPDVPLTYATNFDDDVLNRSCPGGLPNDDDFVPPRNLAPLSVQDVCRSLRYIGMKPPVIQDFLDQSIDGKMLIDLDEDDLNEGFPHLNALERKKIVKFIRGWRPVKD
ncbi:uncharacterized protein LOC106176505 [Lingula anatina]|uniref:Uncharacterized protein LOC106176505 n=1 Tax=Lingula anatina TaxID=7574 RepID=A0A1S3JVQ9_LINAN|nr:uncharacterized protein LOC106176505 [Lingula anatina]|eukprot:XP_013414382.1 uncharacterized protein LOC106176505 [Lingula anatina]